MAVRRRSGYLVGQGSAAAAACRPAGLFLDGRSLMRVIVTGGAGFIGSALVRHLVLEQGYEVLNIDALTYAGNLASLQSVEGKTNYHFLHNNICDRAPIERAVADFRPDRIMHLAAESHVDRSITGAADFIQTN